MNFYVVVTDVFRFYVVSWNNTEFGDNDWANTVVKFGVVIWADTDDITNHVGTIVRPSKRSNVMHFRITRAICQSNGVVAYLALVFVYFFDA